MEGNKSICLWFKIPWWLGDFSVMNSWGALGGLRGKTPNRQQKQAPPNHPTAMHKRRCFSVPRMQGFLNLDVWLFWERVFPHINRIHTFFNIGQDSSSLGTRHGCFFLLEVVYHLLAGMILQVSPTPPYKTDQNACPVVSYGGSPVFRWKKPEKAGEKVNMQSLNMFSPLKMEGFQSWRSSWKMCFLRGLDEHEILQTSWHSKNMKQTLPRTSGFSWISKGSEKKHNKTTHQCNKSMETNP